MSISSINFYHWLFWIFLLLYWIFVSNVRLNGCENGFISVAVTWKNASESISHFHFSIKRSSQMFVRAHTSKLTLVSSTWWFQIVLIIVQVFLLPISWNQLISLKRSIKPTKLIWVFIFDSAGLDSVSHVHVIIITVETSSGIIQIWNLYCFIFWVSWVGGHDHLCCSNSWLISFLVSTTAFYSKAQLLVNNWSSSSCWRHFFNFLY